MTKKPQFSYPTFLGAFFGVLIGTWLRDRYSLPWFEWGPLTALIVALLALLIELIEEKVTHSKQENKPDQP